MLGKWLNVFPVHKHKLSFVEIKENMSMQENDYRENVKPVKIYTDETGYNRHSKSPDFGKKHHIRVATLADFSGFLKPQF